MELVILQKSSFEPISFFLVILLFSVYVYAETILCSLFRKQLCIKCFVFLCSFNRNEMRKTVVSRNVEINGFVCVVLKCQI